MKIISRSIYQAFGLVVLASVALLAQLQAVVPPPDGGYPNFTTAEGTNALQSLTTGSANTAVGWFSLFSNAEGSFNTATGAGALLFNTADQNTAFGAVALLNNTTGTLNTATGVDALYSNETGIRNTAIGAFALFSNTGGDPVFNIGSFNTAVGDEALYSNTTGLHNTATGVAALYSNTIGSENTATGLSALNNNTTGSLNTALGVNAGNFVSTANHVICIGASVGGENVSNTTWIGGVYGVTTQSGTTAPVVVSDTGQLGTAASSEGFKKDIATMEKTSEAILSLRPVTFHYKTDTRGTPQFGLIAEEVAKVNPELVLPDKEGKPYTVRYDAVNAMLLNEFLKEHRKVEQMQKQIEALTVGLQKVSAQLELSKPAPQTVNNP